MYLKFVAQISSYILVVMPKANVEFFNYILFWIDIILIDALETTEIWTIMLNFSTTFCLDRCYIDLCFSPWKGGKIAAPSDAGEVSTTNMSDYDREKEIKAFDESKSGVKGLVDAGILKIPRFFIHSQEEISENSNLGLTHFEIPVIDLEGIEEDIVRRKEIVDRVCHASETWGFFQLVNHGIPVRVMDEMIEGVRRFHEQDNEVKKEFYSRERERKVRFTSNFDLYQSKAAGWRDSLYCTMAPDPPEPEELPTVSRYL